jgi:hypothetical protein
VRVYRVLLCLYPRAFRREYGEDMALLAAEQLREDRAPRVLGRLLLDLAVTIPARHLEARMPHATSSPLVISFIAIATAFIAFGGPLGLGVAVALLALAALIWRRTRPIVAVPEARWWKLLLTGVGLLLALVVVTTIIGELPDRGWYIAMAAMFASFALIGTGVVLGIALRIAHLHN